jgi:putative zinc finger/helix-turn-helix YgiT family protein
MSTRANPKPRRSCFECGQGTLLPVREDYAARTPEGLEIIIPDVPMERCDHCGDVVLSGETSAWIHDQIDRATGRLSREELQAFLDQYRLTQREAEQILGLGEKMIGRWLKGPFQVSASISNYIRVLMADPTAFEILKHRKWSVAGTRRAG